MTFKEKREIEEQLGRKLTSLEQAQIDHYSKKTIRKYCNMHLWSDAHPYEVVEVKTKTKVIVRAMNAKQVVFPQQVLVGGFSAHTVDNYNQDYVYTSNEDAPLITVRWSDAKGQWQEPGGTRFLMSDKPYKHYDYNF